MAARLIASRNGEGAAGDGEGPATLPMACPAAEPIFAGTLDIPQGVESIRIGIYDPQDVRAIPLQPNRMVQVTAGLVIVVDCLEPTPRGVYLPAGTSAG